MYLGRRFRPVTGGKGGDGTFMVRRKKCKIELGQYHPSVKEERGRKRGTSRLNYVPKNGPAEFS